MTLSGTRAIIIELNQNTNPALKDKRVRQAINYAINQVGIVDKINKGFGTPAGQLSPKGYAGYNEALKPQYDLAKAKELMKEAGYGEGGKPLSIEDVLASKMVAEPLRVLEIVMPVAGGAAVIVASKEVAARA